MLPKHKRVKDDKTCRDREPVCMICYGRSDQNHHIKSRGAGGGDTKDNLLSCCVSCHAKIHLGQISKDEVIEYKRRYDCG